jgi:hypothetical protein
MILTHEINQALNTVRLQVCSRCPWAGRCAESDRRAGRDSRCSIFRHLPNVVRIACSRDPMLCPPATAVEREIDERHETWRDAGIPDTLFHFRRDVTRIVKPIVERRAHDRVQRVQRQMAARDANAFGKSLDERDRHLAPECFLG